MCEQSSSRRLLAFAGPVAKSYSFDAAGNVTSDGVHSYAYDDSGSFVSLDSGAASYVHNGLGQRVSKVTGTTTLFVYSEAGHAGAAGRSGRPRKLLGWAKHTKRAAASEVPCWYNRRSPRRRVR